MTNFVTSLSWKDQADQNAPIAPYTVNFATDQVWQFTLSEAAYHDQSIFPRGLIVDNSDFAGNVTVTIGPLQIKVLPYTRQPVEIPTNAQSVTIAGDSATDTPTATFYVKAPTDQVQNQLAIYNAVQQAIAANFLGSMQPIINAEFIFWPDGFSIASTGGFVYGPEGWVLFAPAAQHTVQKIAYGGLALQSVGAGAQVQRNAGSANVGVVIFGTALQTEDSYQFLNSKVTVSFDITFGSTFSSGTGIIACLVGGTGFDNNIMAFPGSTIIEQKIVAPSIATQRVSFTTSAALAATWTQLGLQFIHQPAGVAGANDWYRISRAQIDLGETAQVFRSTPEAAESDRCAYFYEKIGPAVSQTFGMGWNITNQRSQGIIEYRIKRIVPTITASGGNFMLRRAAGNFGVASFNAFGPSISKSLWDANATVAGMTVDASTILQDNGGGTALITINSRM